MRARALAPDELAWIAAVTCATVLIAAIVVAGPPIGRAIPTPGIGNRLWPRDGASYVFGQPEPVKQARVLIALLGPVLLAAAILAGGRRRIVVHPATARVLVLSAQATLLALLLAVMLAQRNLLLHPAAQSWPLLPRWQVFPTRALAGALAFALLLPAAMRRPSVARWTAHWAADTRGRHVACAVAAMAVTVFWLLTAIDTEGTVAHATLGVLAPWSMADTLAILDGRTPLVNFYAMYGEVWAYAAAIPMYLFGTTIGVFSIAMTSISALALLCVYDIFRRVVHSPLVALALFLPFMATGFLSVQQVSGFAREDPTNAQIFSVWPMRYAGPYALAWLLVRHIDGAWPRRRWPLFLAAGLVIVNNLEFSLGATVGLVVALLIARPARSLRARMQLAAEVGIGLLGAALLVTLVTVVRSGAAPHASFLLAYPQLFGASGLTAMPMPTIGVHLLLYVTFAGAIAAAAVRCVRREPDRLLTSMLAWSGIFGLGAASYYAGRSDVFKLTALFSAWGLALALLSVLVARALAARGWSRPRLAELMVLFGFGLTIASLRELPAPWTQVARLQATGQSDIYQDPTLQRFVDGHTVPAERAAILIAMGHRIARNARITNVAPYGFIEAVVTRRQWWTLIESMRREHAHKVFARDDQLTDSQRRFLRHAGFHVAARHGLLIELSDIGAVTAGTGP